MVYLRRNQSVLRSWIAILSIQFFTFLYYDLQVAIKTIKKAKIETEQDLIRIRREIQIMSSVQHPQIIHIYEGEDGVLQ